MDVVVLEGMNSDSAIYSEEFFGPVFNLFKVKNSKDAMDLANKSDYGLSSCVFTEDLVKARNCAHRLRSGNVFINEAPYTGSDFPTGGIKGSGYGRECYSDGLHDTANRKTIIYKK
jgi:succinate-semialdehyde dehydrogenase/glutarate-semialdehyde dehydrogenase